MRPLFQKNDSAPIPDPPILRSKSFLTKVLLLSLIFLPTLQSFLLYLHWISFPFFVDWSKGGERFGFRGILLYNTAGSVRPLKIVTKGGMLRGWHIVGRASKDRVESHSVPDLADGTSRSTTLASAPLVFLYCHGNAGNIATGPRTAFYKVYLVLM